MAGWLLLLSILMHALAPPAQQTQRYSGAAFSPWTVEVSLTSVQFATSDKETLLRVRDDPNSDRSIATNPKAPVEFALRAAQAAQSRSTYWLVTPAGSFHPASSPFAARSPPYA